jgi:hypothetical protein
MKESIEHFIDMREHMSRVLHKSVFLVNAIIFNIMSFFSFIFNLLMMIVKAVTLIFGCHNNKMKERKNKGKK